MASRKVSVRSVGIKHHRRPTKLTNECVNVDECEDSVDPKTAEMWVFEVFGVGILLLLLL